MALSQTVTKITPTIATKWLNETNAHNRTLNNAHVKSLAEQMANGLWKLNGEAIIFTKDKARLLDGQHRLWACIESDTPFSTVVVEGVDEENFATIDTGVKRSTKDVLDIVGVQSADNRTLGAAASLVLQYRAGTLGTHKAVSKAEILDAVVGNPGIAEWVAATKKNKGWTTAYASPLAAVMYLAAHKYPDQAAEFVEAFTTGENLSAKSPVLALRNRLGTEKRLSAMVKMALITSAWNAFVRGKEMAKVQLPKGGASATNIKITGAKS